MWPKEVHTRHGTGYQGSSSVGGVRQVGATEALFEGGKNRPAKHGEKASGVQPRAYRTSPGNGYL